MPIDRISSSLRGKLVAAFSAVAVFVAMFVAAVTAIHFATLDRAAQMEAEHVAEFIADAAVRNQEIQPRLQDYVARLTAIRKRDVVIVDRSQIGLADANPDEVGMSFDHDSGDEVGKTIADGKTRTFVEENALHPEGARQIVECVETQAQIEFLRQQACDEFQGFFFSPAVTASQFWDLLAVQMTAEAAQ